MMNTTGGCQSQIVDHSETLDVAEVGISIDSCTKATPVGAAVRSLNSNTSTRFCLTNVFITNHGINKDSEPSHFLNLSLAKP